MRLMGQMGRMGRWAALAGALLLAGCAGPTAGLQALGEASAAAVASPDAVTLEVLE